MVSYRIISHHIVPYRVLPYHIVPYRIIPYHIVPYLSYRTISYHTIPYHIAPYSTIPYYAGLCVRRCLVIRVRLGSLNTAHISFASPYHRWSAWHKPKDNQFCPLNTIATNLKKLNELNHINIIIHSRKPRPCFCLKTDRLPLGTQFSGNVSVVQTFSVFWTFYSFVWVIPRLLYLICPRFETHCQFHLHWQWKQKEYPNNLTPGILPVYTTYEHERDSVPKRRHIQFRRRGISQKKKRIPFIFKDESTG
jgi:hypothetical protein